MLSRAIAFGALMALLLPAASRGQQSGEPAPAASGDNAELVKELSNPISDLVSVPFQFKKSLWTLTLQSETTANWEVEEDRWTVPVNVLVSRLSAFGLFPASYQFGFGVYAAHPEVGPSWKIRSAIVLLLPRGK